MCELGSVVIASGALTNQGAADDIAPPQFPAVADPFLTVTLAGVADELGIERHVGVVASTDTFFEGQERSASSANQRLLRRLHGMIDEYHDLGVLSFEMEAGTLFKMGCRLRLRCRLRAGHHRRADRGRTHPPPRQGRRRGTSHRRRHRRRRRMVETRTVDALTETVQGAVRAVALPLSVRIVIERGLAGSSSTSSVSLPLSDCTSTR